MKKLIPLLFLLLPLNQWSQTYHLLPDSCTFCMYLYSSGGSSFNDDYYDFIPELTTTINGNEYVEFYANDGVIGIRQTENKLVGYHPDLDQDVTLMNFDAILGDTLYGLYSNGFFYSARVEELDSFQLNDGSYHRFMNLTGLRVSQNGLDSSSWADDLWEITWNERGLCHENGGLAYNIPFFYISISLVYSYATWCTTDPLYNIPNDNACDNCENPTRGDAGTLQLTNHRFSIHPNPAIDRVKIVFPSSEWRKVEIIDALGRVRERQECAESICELNGTANLSPGLYYLHVYTAYGLMGIEQLVVQ